MYVIATGWTAESSQPMSSYYYGYAETMWLPEGRGGGRHGETTVTWLESPVLGCSPIFDEVGNLEVGPMLDDDQA